MKQTEKTNPLSKPIDFQALGDCVNAIGSPQFPQLISECCLRISGAESVFLNAFFLDGAPAPFYASSSQMGDRKNLQLYLDIAYVLDPFYEVFKQNRGDELLMLDEIAPDDFKHSEYYLKFYKSMRLTIECGLMLPISSRAALFFSFGASRPERQINRKLLRETLPLIASLVRRHWTVLSPENSNGLGRLAAHLDAALHAFGNTVLSPRETEIVAMILKGHSSKTIASAFQNSPETIKVHRKRIYTKLGIASQGELLSLFLASVMRMPPNAVGDPLAYYAPETEFK